MPKKIFLTLFLVAFSVHSLAKTPRIINGIPASTQIYPWIVNYDGCSGTLIAPRWVLTAAHCFGDLNADELPDLILGSDNIVELAPDTIHAKAIQIIPHPYFYEFNNDLALIKLAEPVTDVPFVTLRSNPHIEENSKLIAIGWGATASDATGESIDFSDTLLQTRLAIKNNSLCSEHFGPGVTDNMLCATGPTTIDKSDTCQGDSGGPLLMESNGGYVQIGITSFGGKPCGVPDVPGVYSRVSQYQDWIKQYVPEAKFDNTYQPEFPAVCKTLVYQSLNIDIPCVEYQNQIYHLTLPKTNDEPLTWSLLESRTSNCPSNKTYCTIMDNQFNLEIHGIAGNKRNYQAQLKHVLDQKRHTWVFESLRPQ